MAARKGTPQIVQLLLDAGAEIGAVDSVISLFL